MTPPPCRELLADRSRAGVYRLAPEGARKLRAAARDLGFATRTASMRGVRGKADFLAALASALAFPDWFGFNWDALEDCLGDLSWMQAAGYVTVLEHCEEFRACAHADFDRAIAVFEAAAGFWRGRGTAFWVFIDVHDGGIAPAPRCAR
ncbi:MAG TPA: hypothetical protein DHV08_10620 [Rhodocyclaceae bacterium]|nr:MAG: hypothetical protein AUK49_12295 [Betaproteobacteria bacterium CG2_30_68_42]PIX75060.1 MAG: hypothetical protein COZ38_07575 [Rhodocyclales bacterium CG_4_10_14_3_um_filter_68_10]PJA56701.1 MAG: hypothetical protein CO164_11840 [Rhodocyclales bacterium CG_4_9_14_3_um_filter_68_10]HCX33954.1 hypothetical protein [Rhodocyclaceae bacterium]